MVRCRPGAPLDGVFRTGGVERDRRPAHFSRPVPEVQRGEAPHGHVFEWATSCRERPRGARRRGSHRSRRVRPPVGLGCAVRGLHGSRPADLRRPDDVLQPALDRGSRGARVARRRRGDRRGALRRHGHPPPGRQVRAARDPRGPEHVGEPQLAAARDPAVRAPDRGGCRGCEHRPGPVRSGPRDDLPQGPRGRGQRRDPDRPRRRPLDHLAQRHRHRRNPQAGQHRHRPLRRPRRHRAGLVGPARRPRVADAPADRIGRGSRQELRPGGPARVLAAAGGPRLDGASRASAGT